MHCLLHCRLERELERSGCSHTALQVGEGAGEVGLQSQGAGHTFIADGAVATILGTGAVLALAVLRGPSAALALRDADAIAVVEVCTCGMKAG